MNANPEQKQARPNRRIFYIVLIIVLIIINGLLLYNNLQTREERDVLEEQTMTLEEEKAEVTERNTELIAEISDLQAELESQKGISTELDRRIDSMQNVLQQMKSSFQKSINNKDYQLSQVRKELNNTRAEFEIVKNKYLEEIAELNRQNQVLIDTLQQRDVNIEGLEQRIKRGEILSVSNINAYGVRYKSNNKEVQTNTAKRVEKIMICFQMAENRITDPGYKPVHLRIINPEGTTLSLEAMGSGTFTLENGESSMYTKKVNINYDPSNSGKEYCTDWTQNTAFQVGEYKVEIYQDGVLIGKDSFELEKGGLF